MPWTLNHCNAFAIFGKRQNLWQVRHTVSTETLALLGKLSEPAKPTMFDVAVKILRFLKPTEKLTTEHRYTGEDIKERIQMRLAQSIGLQMDEA